MRADLAISALMLSRILIVASLLALAACSAPPPPPTPQAPPPKPVVTAPPPPARPTGDWTDWPLAAGDWVYRQDDRCSIALFGVANADALVTLRCDKARQRMYLARAGSGAGRMVVRSSSTMKEFTGQQTGGALPYIATEIGPRDAILDAVIFSRGRFALEVAGQMPLAIPSWAEIGRVVEDCRV
jgi:hypothetical protein